MTFPSISIITPVGRPDPYLRDAIGSINSLAAAINQVDVEWVVSLDGVLPEPGLFADVAVPMRIVEPVSAVRRGPGFTRNRGLAEARGNVIVALDSDDTLNPNGVARALHVLCSTDASWVAGAASTIDERNNPSGVLDMPSWPQGPLAPGAFLDHVTEKGWYPFHCSAMVMAADAVRAVGGWDVSSTLARDEDVAMVARLSRAFPGHWLTEVLLNYRINPESLTRTEAWGEPEARRYLVRERLDDPSPSLGSYDADLAAQLVEAAAVQSMLDDLAS